MKIARRIVKGLISCLGYEIRRREEVNVRFDNFRNLAEAYEILLNRTAGDNPVPPDETRPKLLARLLGTPPSEAYAIVESLAKTMTVDGDVCEFGVAQGETSALIAHEILSTDKMLHLFDSFEGLPEPSEKDRLIDDIFSLGSIKAYTGKMSCAQNMVISRLNEIGFPSNRYCIHKGFIEQLIRVDDNLPAEVSFAYVDFDLYEPTKIALKFIHNVTKVGAVIVLDDYDFFSTGPKTALVEFVKENDPDHKIYDVVISDRRIGCFAVLTRKS